LKVAVIGTLKKQLSSPEKVSLPTQIPSSPIFLFKGTGLTG